MYKIIGGDQKEYGPVSFDQLAGWIRDYRANAQTLVQREGGPWVPLGTLSEFQSLLDPASATTPDAGSLPPLPPPTPFGGATNVPGSPTPGLGGGFGGGGMGPGIPGYTGGAESRAREIVSGPATALLITGILGAVMVVVGVVIGLMGMGMQTVPDGLPPEVRQIFEMMQQFQSPAVVIIEGVLKLAVSGLIIFGALRMRALSSFALVVTASILAIVPCTSPCCCIGIPIGIWVLVVLFKPEVKTAFH